MMIIYGQPILRVPKKYYKEGAWSRSKWLQNNINGKSQFNNG